MRILFYGAGEAGIGIGDLIVEALVAEGVPQAAARRQCWFVDSKGLVVRSRTDLVEHKRRFAHEHAPLTDLAAVVEDLKPHALIGVSGTAQAFTEPVVRAMARLHARPIVFALSNPTTKAECTATQAYGWSDGRAIFASGSPFPPVDFNGVRHVPGQGNNIYIFPGVGLGALVSEAREVTDEMFLAAAQTLARLVQPEDLALGRVYPSLTKIREVSLHIAVAVAETAYAAGLAGRPRPADVLADIRSRMFEPVYPSYV